MRYSGLVLMLSLLWLVFLACSTNQVPSNAGQPPAAEKKAIALDNGLELAVSVKKPGEGSVEVNKELLMFGSQNYPKTLDNGVEISLAFQNPTGEPIENHVIASSNTTVSGVVVIENGQEIAPVAMKLDGDKYGYRTVDVAAGIVIGGCEDNPPAAIQKDGKHVGIITVFCVKPDEKDTIVVMFAKDAFKNFDKVKIRVKCKLCPKEGLTLDGKAQ